MVVTRDLIRQRSERQLAPPSIVHICVASYA